MRILVLVNVLILSLFANAQSTRESITYEDLLMYKVEENRFQFGWLPSAYGEIPCYRNYTKTNSTFYSYESNRYEYEIKIIPKTISLNRQSREFEIKGKITGAWESVMPREFGIYIGNRNDTISELTYFPINYRRGIFNRAKIKKVGDLMVLDTVPAFYLSNFKKFEAYSGERNEDNSKFKEILFDIKSEIDENSILVIGVLFYNAEIFEIGKLLH